MGVGGGPVRKRLLFPLLSGPALPTYPGIYLPIYGYGRYLFTLLTKYLLAYLRKRLTHGRLPYLLLLLLLNPEAFPAIVLARSPSSFSVPPLPSLPFSAPCLRVSNSWLPHAPVPARPRSDRTEPAAAAPPLFGRMKAATGAQKDRRHETKL
ncbi:hypothetical protein LZ30DRAFT_111374 [Colletotrichum cereale]|nr:hypothetical protein LZ30DRAFT_111374 [Colletotrichum cereale]